MQFPISGVKDGIGLNGGVRWHTKTMTAIAPTARTYELIAAIADRLAFEADETVAAMDAAVIAVVPEFGADGPGTLEIIRLTD